MSVFARLNDTISCCWKRLCRMDRQMRWEQLQLRQRRKPNQRWLHLCHCIEVSESFTKSKLYFSHSNSSFAQQLKSIVGNNRRKSTMRTQFWRENSTKLPRDVQRFRRTLHKSHNDWTMLSWNKMKKSNKIILQVKNKNFRQHEDLMNCLHNFPPSIAAPHHFPMEFPRTKQGEFPRLKLFARARREKFFSVSFSFVLCWLENVDVFPQVFLSRVRKKKVFSVLFL